MYIYIYIYIFIPFPSWSGFPYDSAVANVGIWNGMGHTQLQDHREFIVYDGKQAYPELAIHFREDESSSDESEA